MQTFPEDQSTVEEMLFFVDGQIRTAGDLTKVAGPLVARIRKDREWIFGSVEGDTLDSRNRGEILRTAAKLDRMTLAEYLETLDDVGRG